MVGAASDVMDENQTIKGLLAMLQVRRDDFVFNPQQTIAAQQEAIGLRLLRNLDGSPPGAAPPPQQQQDAQQGQQPGEAAEPGTQQRQQQQGAAPGSQQQQQHEEASAGAAAAAVAFDVSPGCLLPAITPGGMRTVSPKIAAFRGDQQQPQTAGPTGGWQDQPLVAPPTVVPASPYDFPAEAQIAAAALTAKQGDTAAALLTLLDKAIEGRMERQQTAPQQAQQQQEAQQRQQQAQQQQQRQQQMYTM